MNIKSIQTLVSEALQEIKTIDADEAFNMVVDNECNLIDIQSLQIEQILDRAPLNSEPQPTLIHMYQLTFQDLPDLGIWIGMYFLLSVIQQAFQ